MTALQIPASPKSESTDSDIFLSAMESSIAQPSPILIPAEPISTTSGVRPSLSATDDELEIRAYLEGGSVETEEGAAIRLVTEPQLTVPNQRDCTPTKTASNQADFPERFQPDTGKRLQEIALVMHSYTFISPLTDSRVGYP